MSSPIPACDYNCFYATTTTLHTFATRHTLVELAQCITANISAPSRSLGSLRHDSRKVRPHAHREHGASPNSVKGDHYASSRVQMRADTARTVYAARITSPGLGASAWAAGGTGAGRPPAPFVVARRASLTRRDQRPLASVQSNDVT